MKQRLLLALVKGLGRLPLGAARVFGGALGRLMWLCGGRAVQTTKRNLTLCYPQMPDAERLRLARASLIETGRAAVEIPVVWRWSDSGLRQRVLDYEGVDHIRRSKERGKGLIMLTPHLGNWEVLPCVLTLHGKMTVLYQPPENSALDQYICRARERAHLSLAPTNRRGVGAMVRALKRGEMVGVLPDQVPDPGYGGLEAPFFGEPALTMTLVHSLIKSTDCDVLICYALRVSGGFKVVVAPCDTDIYSDKPDLAVAALNRSVENCIEKAPAQYQWEYKRFKGRAQGEPY